MIEKASTVCSRDCPDACRVVVSVEAGRAIRLQGDPDDPVTRGFLCERTSRFLERQYASDRFLHPCLRRGGRLAPVSWDEALDFAADKLRSVRAESGGAAIFHYRSGGSLGLQKLVADAVFEAFGPVTIKSGNVCDGAGEAAQRIDFGHYDSHDLLDCMSSKVIVLWGKNVHVSGPHLLPVLNEARRRGAMLVAIDVIPTRLQRLADLFVQVRPGGDFFLAMALANRLFAMGAVDPQAPEYCDHFEDYRTLVSSRSAGEWAALADVSEQQLQVLADAYGRRRPGSIFIGWGLARRRFGAASVRAIDALAAITGNLGIKGGGVSFYFARRSAFDTSSVRGEDVAPRTIREACFGPDVIAAKDPPIRAIWITAGNPVSMLPESRTVEKALRQAELTVVVDTHPTDTTDCADLVLPTLTFLEDQDLFGAYGNHHLRASTPVLAAPEGPRHEVQILCDLAQRLGCADPLPKTREEWQSRWMGRLEKASITVERMQKEAVKNPFASEVLFPERVFPTPSGRMQLLHQAIPAPESEEEYPFTLLSTSTPKAQSSQQAQHRRQGLAEIRVHPGAVPTLADGSRVFLESRIGRLEVVLRHDPTLRTDLVVIEKGGMMRDGRCCNELVGAVESDQGGAAAYYDARVRIVL